MCISRRGDHILRVAPNILEHSHALARNQEKGACMVYLTHNLAQMSMINLFHLGGGLGGVMDICKKRHP